MNYAGRREQLRRLLKKQKNAPPALLVTSEANVRYLTGFTGDSTYLLLSASDAVMISDRRYTTQLEDECADLVHDVRGPETEMPDQVVATIKKLKVANVGFDPANMTVAAHETLTKALDKIELVGAAGLVEQLRIIKDKDEVRLIREAIHVAQRSFEVIRASLRPEQTEKQVGDAMEMQVRLFGGECTSFTPIVGVGSNAALPHYRPGARKIGESDLVLIDWGARVGGYVSDLTRVLATAKISPKLRKVYGVVSIAQQRAIEKIRAGVSMQEVDAAARETIAKSGFGKYFGHGLGHGIGLQIHEAPRMGPLIDEPLQAGMVVTVEPGVYLPGWGGVRIEDDVLVTKTGYEVLRVVMSEGLEGGNVFDVDRIRSLVELMEQHDLREIELRQGEQRIQLKRGAEPLMTIAPSASASAPAVSHAAPVAPPPTVTAPPAVSTPAVDESKFIYIESPMVGTYYSKANPEAAPFVKVGDRVNADTVVCIIEAMKVFNEIAAECSGVVAAVLVDNEEPVEFGKKLFKIEKA